MRCQGKITEWIDERGFGFIVPDEGGKKVFVHIKSFDNRRGRPVVNDVVTYMLLTDERGRLQAAKVSSYVKPVLVSSYFLENILLIFLSILFLGFVTFSALSEKLSLLVMVYYFAISGITFFAYSFDKSAAQDGEWRLSEDYLHILSIVGGWPGALFAQVLIRHKSKKQSFRIVFWGTAGLNCILLFAVVFQTGKSF